MFGGLWNFLKRHKKKILFGSLAAGATSYVTWQYVKDWLSDYMVQRMMKAIVDSAESGAAGSAEERRQERFAYKQKVSDSHAGKRLSTLCTVHGNCFEVQTYKENLQAATTKEGKLEAFRKMGEECVAKAVSSIYTIHLLLLLHRINFNIVGRELEVASEKEEALDEESLAAHEAFLLSLGHFQSASCNDIAKLIRKAVCDVMEREEMGPQVSVTEETLGNLFEVCCREADKECVGKQSDIASRLLPESLEAKIDAKIRAKVKALLDEARDYLESPQFLQVFQACCTCASKNFAAALLEDLQVAAGDTHIGIGPWPLAKFNGAMIKMSTSVFEQDVSASALVATESTSDSAAPATEAKEASGENPRTLNSALFAAFSEDPRVEDLCSGLYFQGIEAPQ
mmetsp:Transcript_51287/g.109029  ORF Transcript_51287/g.109029 Transcript_51287/m.109029 type:complete len:398 (+) Transcript_51287:117-1310(+)|eukprot:CAMPEP_0206462358 /NCGR_PEP_ID=MMETSP0324_2-20121206/25941_1 /ASSEMBLY_ACC=CAM_ASM_000836 /TAXON_ID=2866 /ORGANISM="Crypthecodinium cohnii, Strain Seligo" /LENGTH=397 /DNA_ID=CAMNT_0053934519 /DNA_START=113 /DNA_END=1306 /DNA_ORIENTATION=-